MQIGVAIGSNQGKREKYIATAVERLRDLDPKLQLATVIETAPEACPAGSPAFLNTVAVLEYQGDLQMLLEYLQELEQVAGRQGPRKRVKNAPRTLDLDILFAGDTVIDQPGLHIPHPRMMDRLFVLEPLAELLPDLKPFVDRPSVSERVKELKYQ